MVSDRRTQSGEKKRKKRENKAAAVASTRKGPVNGCWQALSCGNEIHLGSERLAVTTPRSWYRQMDTVQNERNKKKNGQTGEKIHSTVLDYFSLSVPHLTIELDEDVLGVIEDDALEAAWRSAMLFKQLHWR